MPVVPRSAMHYRPITADVAEETAFPITPPVSRTSRRPSPPQQFSQPDTSTRILPTRRKRSWLFFLGIGMVLSIVLVLLGQGVIAWWSTTLDDWHYGYPRTYQTDAVVGHNGDSAAHPSHFIALNFHGTVEIIEIPAGDASKARIYIGPHFYGPGSDRVPVTLHFNQNTQTHLLDMIIAFQGSQVIFKNENGAFQPDL